LRQQWQIKRGQGLELDLGLGLELELELEIELELGLGLDLEFLVLELDLGFESVLEQVAPGKSLRPIGGASMMGLVMSSRHSLDASMPEASFFLCGKEPRLSHPKAGVSLWGLLALEVPASVRRKLRISWRL
jgi:hypothetical protein